MVEIHIAKDGLVGEPGWSLHGGGNGQVKGRQTNELSDT